MLLRRSTTSTQSSENTDPYLERGISLLGARKVFSSEDDDGERAIAGLRNPQGFTKEINRNRYTEAGARMRNLFDPQAMGNLENAEEYRKHGELHQFSMEDFPGYENDNVFFLKHGNSMVQMIQNRETCYLCAPTVLQTYSIVHHTGTVSGRVININEYIKFHSTNEQLLRYLFPNKNNEGGKSREILEAILQPNSILLSSGIKILEGYSKYGPALITQFKVHSDFYEDKKKYYGKPEGEIHGLHAMVLVGWRKDEGKIYYLLQNWWLHKQFLEVDEEYLKRSGATVVFIKTPQEDIPPKFKSITNTM